MVEYANGLVRSGQCDRVFVVCDRGLIDGKAYTQERVWFKMLDMLGVTEKAICDERYDIAVIMETAAIGACAFYDTEGIRYESMQEAANQHRVTAKVWERHPNIRHINN
jgi:hypothetical protein